MSTLSSDEPNELFLESIIRAKTMEYISSKGKFKKVKYMAFMTGVLSNFGSILNVPLKNLLESFPVSNEVKLALNNQQNALFELLKLAKFYEKLDHEHIKNILVKYNIEESFHFDCYKKALKWCMTYVA